MGKLIFILIALTGFVNETFAHSLNCEILESKKNIDTNNSFIVEVNDKQEGIHQISKTKGELTSSYLRVLKNQMLWIMTDPITSQPMSAIFNYQKGSFQNFRWSSQTTNTLYIDGSCADEEVPPSTTYLPNSFTCILTEHKSDGVYKTQFILPISQNGHEIFPFKTSNKYIKGWATAYKGNIALNVENTNSLSSLTIAGLWDDGISMSWYPTTQPEKIILTCLPSK